MAVTTVAVPKSAPTFALKSRGQPVLGFGAQLNTWVFTKSGTDFKRGVGGRRAQDLTGPQHKQLAKAVEEVGPGHCRIFVQRGLNPDSPRGREAPGFDGFLKTVKLAEDAGAQTVNLTWWGQGPYAANKARIAGLDWPSKKVLTGWPHPNLPKWPDALLHPEGPGGVPGPREQMRRFARIIQVARAQSRCVTHATIQNEPNGPETDIALRDVPNLSMRLYEHLYRCLADALTELDDPQDEFPNLGEAIQIVAGDLVQDGRKKTPTDKTDHQDAWIEYLHANMDREREGFPSVLDAYSIHVYWKPGPKNKGGEFPFKAKERLDNLVRLANGLGITKPIYITEYGVRFPVRPESDRPSTFEGIPMERSPESVFEHAWFNARAPQLGYVGLVKWVMYRTDLKSGWGKWGLIDSPKAAKPFDRTPMFNMTQLFNRLVGQDWIAKGLRENDDFLISRFAGPAGAEESIFLLNFSHNNTLTLRLTDLMKGRRYEQAAINANGRAGLTRPNAVTADTTSGGANVQIPARGLLALSTRPIGLSPVG
jgi:hypothetical protein